jgi:hypothetical protein
MRDSNAMSPADNKPETSIISQLIELVKGTAAETREYRTNNDAEHKHLYDRLAEVDKKSLQSCAECDLRKKVERIEISMEKFQATVKTAVKVILIGVPVLVAVVEIVVRIVAAWLKSGQPLPGQ